MEKVVCSKCHGNGQIWPKGICVKCFGEGRLDWVENVVGKRKFTIRPGVYTEGGIVAKIIQDNMAEGLSRVIDHDIIEGIKKDLYEQKYIKERRIRKKVKV